MKTIPQNPRDTRISFAIITQRIFIKAIPIKVFFSVIFIVANFFAKSQSITPSTINTTGNSASSGNFQVEWSVGEAVIATVSNGNLVVTSGVLQPYVANQPRIRNLAGLWLPDEIRVYPNPTRDFIEINILHRFIGKNTLELVDIQGRKVMETQFEYNGAGRIVKWDLSKLLPGDYFLYIQQLSPVSGKTIKRGAFKILKLN